MSIDINLVLNVILIIAGLVGGKKAIKVSKAAKGMANVILKIENAVEDKKITAVEAKDIIKTIREYVEDLRNEDII